VTFIDASIDASHQLVSKLLLAAIPDGAKSNNRKQEGTAMDHSDVLGSDGTRRKWPGWQGTTTLNCVGMACPKRRVGDVEGPYIRDFLLKSRGNRSPTVALPGGNFHALHARFVL
jgi:hypothetical protein